MTENLQDPVFDGANHEHVYRGTYTGEPSVMTCSCGAVMAQTWSAIPTVGVTPGTQLAATVADQAWAEARDRATWENQARREGAAAERERIRLALLTLRDDPSWQTDRWAYIAAAELIGIDLGSP